MVKTVPTPRGMYSISGWSPRHGLGYFYNRVDPSKYLNLNSLPIFQVKAKIMENVQKPTITEEKVDALDLEDLDLTPTRSVLSKEASGGRTDAEIRWETKLNTLLSFPSVHFVDAVCEKQTDQLLRKCYMTHFKWPIIMCICIRARLSSVQKMDCLHVYCQVAWEIDYVDKHQHLPWAMVTIR